MTKRRGAKPAAEQNQADLFGAAAPPSPRLPKKAHTAQRAAPSLAKTSPGQARSNPSAQPIPPNALLNVRQAAARLGLSKSTLDKMRGAGKGPRFIKSTDRAVRYDCDDLDAWIANRRRGRAPRD
ncbi:helix-turn-helix domain-containing protein [Vitreimonas sp.]|uniref:helix-turn-helix transcriptional regulator n=1 Tax=Vitreimonas sp. TaxID=3069702 RepID=UPI0032C234C1